MKFIAVTNDTHPVEHLANIVAQIHPFVDYVHIREKSKTASELIAFVEIVKQLAIPMEKIVFHDRLDVALVAGSVHIHLPSYSIPIPAVRQAFPHLRIGRSIHSLDEAIEAERDGADYVLYGHCFETDCKKGLAPNGLETLYTIQQALHIPVFAIGGITIDHIHMLQLKNVAGFAVMSSIFAATNPVEATCAYRNTLEGGIKA